MTRTRWDAPRYDANHSYVWKYGAGLIELLAPRLGERILDLGCGTGHLTAEIAASGAEVVGLDKDPNMITRARQNYPDLEFEIADATDFAFDEGFDAVFSNAVLHWIKEPVQVAVCVRRCLKPGGRFVAEFGGQGNIQAVVEALHRALAAAGYPERRALSPWYFPGIAAYTAILEEQGLKVTDAHLFDRPTALEGGDEALDDWLQMFVASFWQGLTAREQRALRQAVVAQLRPVLFRDGVWSIDYRRLRVMALG
jgi:trans-aconitate methyltransferase